MLKNFKLKTFFKKIKHQFRSVYIFSNKYLKQTKNNEFYSLLILESLLKLKILFFINYLYEFFVKSYYKGDITIWTIADYKQIIKAKFYFNKNDLNQLFYLKKIYENKIDLKIPICEVIENYWTKNLFNLNKLLKIKRPYQIGGSF